MSEACLSSCTPMIGDSLLFQCFIEACCKELGHRAHNTYWSIVGGQQFVAAFKIRVNLEMFHAADMPPIITLWNRLEIAESFLVCRCLMSYVGIGLGPEDLLPLWGHPRAAQMLDGMKGKRSGSGFGMIS